MASKSEQYVEQLERDLSKIGITGAYFCSQQYKRWQAVAGEAFEQADSSSETLRVKAEKPATDTGKSK